LERNDEEEDGNDDADNTKNIMSHSYRFLRCENALALKGGSKAYSDLLWHN